MTDLPPPPPENPPPPPASTPPPPFASPPPPPAFASEPPPGYQAYGAPGPQVEYASFGSRLGGYLIDGIIMFLFFVPALVALLAGPTEIEACSVDESGNITIGEELNALCEGPTDGTLAFAGFLALLGLVGVFVYQAKLLGGPSGATVGMRAVGIKAVVADTGGPLGAGKAIGRFLFASIFSGFFYLGYLWMLWDGKKQTWQDKVVSSIVIRA